MYEGAFPDDEVQRKKATDKILDNQFKQVFIMVSRWTSVYLSARPSVSLTSVRPFVFRFRMIT